MESHHSLSLYPPDHRQSLPLPRCEYFSLSLAFFLIWQPKFRYNGHKSKNFHCQHGKPVGRAFNCLNERSLNLCMRMSVRVFYPKDLLLLLLDVVQFSFFIKSFACIHLLTLDIFLPFSVSLTTDLRIGTGAILCSAPNNDFRFCTLATVQQFKFNLFTTAHLSRFLPHATLRIIKRNSLGNGEKMSKKNSIMSHIVRVANEFYDSK